MAAAGDRPCRSIGRIAQTGIAKSPRAVSEETAVSRKASERMKGEPVANGTSLMDSDYARIFVSPRATIRAIVDRDPRDRVIAIAAIAGFVGALAAAVQFRSPSAFAIGKQSIPTIAPATMWK